jgi:predicted anti-sigma-YlaC factor YlaD
MKPSATTVVTATEDFISRVEAASAVNVLPTDGLVIQSATEVRRKKCMRRTGLVFSAVVSLGVLGLTIWRAIEPGMTTEVIRVMTNSTN